MSHPTTAAKSQSPPCRFCGHGLTVTFVDLGMSPLCQTHVAPEQLGSMEQFYPLHARVCDRCFLVQLEEFVAPADIFGEYAYFSSYSDSWVEHARRYCLAMRERFRLDAKSRVVEIASNDGYLLQHFVHMGIGVLGIEPAANVAEAARAKGVPSLVKFFGRRAAGEIRAEHGAADLLLGNNVLAHVPDLNDFVAGLRVLLADRGVVTMEFPHLQRLMDENQFDTIYHEHFSYFSFMTVERVFAVHGLVLFDVEELPTHGGSLRIYARHADDKGKPVGARVAALRAREQAAGFGTLACYGRFGERVRESKREILEFLIGAKGAGRSIAGYGAPGKGNTLLNYCGIRTDFLDFTVDRNPYKQGKFTPGTRIPILAPEAILERRPDDVFILPWNLRDEIAAQCAAVRGWGGRLVTPIPTVEILDWQSGRWLPTQRAPAVAASSATT
ncbi:MAG: methyltransferase domain-containing protein [Gammaproteobacteria bacterium]